MLCVASRVPLTLQGESGALRAHCASPLPSAVLGAAWALFSDAPGAAALWSPLTPALCLAVSIQANVPPSPPSCVLGHTLNFRTTLTFLFLVLYFAGALGEDLTAER